MTHEYSAYGIGMYDIHNIMQAYRQGVMYPRYLFFFYGWYADQWWVGTEDEDLTCTSEQREMVISSGLAPVLDEFTSNCSRVASTGTVSICTLLLV